MEAEKLQRTGRIIHHGHNIRRVRMEKNIKQEALCDEVHMTQPAISKCEKMQVIDENILQRFAKALNIPVEDLKTMEEEAPSTVIFENNNTFTDNKGEVDFIGTTYDENNNHAVYNPIDKVTELFERMLKEKDARILLLEKMVKDLKQSK